MDAGKAGWLLLALVATLPAACGGHQQPAPTPVASVTAPVATASAAGSVEQEGPAAEPPEPTPAPAPRAVLGAILAQGELPAAVIQRIARQRTPNFRRCYEERLKTRPDLTGLVVVHFVIDASGDLSEPVNTEQDMGDEGMAQCVRDVVKTIIFPQPAHGTVAVTLPILFAR